MIQSDLTNGPVGPHLRKMTIPMIWGILSIMSMNIVDTWYVAQLGTEPLAAMGFTIPVVSILLSLAFGIGIGSSSLISRAIGAGDTTRVRIYATQSLFIGLSVALSFAIIGYHNIDTIFIALGAPDTLLPLIHEFMDIWFLGSFIVVIPMVGNSALRAAGNTFIPSMIMIVVAIVNIILDPILIFGYFGLPALGLQGAAIATVISYSFALIIGLYLLAIKLRFLSLKDCRGRIIESWKAILHLAIPAIGTNLIAPLSVAFSTWLVAGYSASAVAGFGVASRIESLCLVVIMAISSIMGPFVGQNWGAKRKERVAEALRLSQSFSLLFCIGITIILMMFSHELSMFFTDDAAVVSSSAHYLELVPWSYFFLAVIMITSSTYNGMGKPTPSLLMSFMRLIGLFVPLAFVGQYFYDLDGIYIAAALSNFIVGLGAIIGTRSLMRA
ncbi:MULTISPECIES: MATE family efflux transporter [unclassified Oleiphilus]|uniref:MATE family efflux transporter n=4 Tax=Oleiphilus TaxID=141450 RepID=UPI0008398A83|nr:MULTISPECIES: MATE family efflux transporter [unclassified Oleiphilus]